MIKKRLKWFNNLSQNNVCKSVYDAFSAIVLVVSLSIVSSVAHSADIVKPKNDESIKQENQQALAKPTLVILLGAPGSGKGTQAVKIAKELKLSHISTGDILRENIKNGTELGKKVKSYTDSGKLVPDALVSEIVFTRIDQPDNPQGYILDGYPRTIAQAKALDEHLTVKAKQGSNARVVVINLDVPDEKLVDRILKRANEKAEKRSDDNPEVLKQRLKVYHEQTEPVVAYYKGKGELISINGGDKNPEEVFKEIMVAYKGKQAKQ